jgi:long-chain acyl-CoA synthetase
MPSASSGLRPCAQLSPAWKRAEVGHAARPDRAGARRGRRDASPLLAEHLGARTPSPTSTTPWRRPLRPQPGPAPPPSVRAVDDDDPSSSSARARRTGMPKAVRHTHASMGLATEHWVTVLGLGPDDRFQVATPALAHPRALEPAGRGVGRRHGPAAPPLRPRRGARPDQERADDAGDGGGPHRLAMANHPRLEDHDLSSLRYIMWGATPVTESVAERGDQAHRGAVACRPTGPARCR